MVPKNCSPRITTPSSKHRHRRAGWWPRAAELLLLPGWWYAISAESFLDRNETVPDTVPLAAQIRCPVPAIRGSTEDRSRYPAEEFQAACGGPRTVEIIANCDHFHIDREAAVTRVVAEWLAQTLLPA